MATAVGSALAAAQRMGYRIHCLAADVRFTTKGNVLYAFLMGWPESGRATIAALAKSRGLAKGNVENVALLGSPGPLEWTLAETGLKVRLPGKKPGDYAFALKIEGLEIV